MKRIAAIAGFVLVAGLGVGAFVFAANDGNGHKGKAATVQKDDNTTTSSAKPTETTTKVTTAPQVASDSPTKPSTDDNTSNGKSNDNSEVFRPGDDKPELDGYEARRVFVGVDPSYAILGRSVKVEVRGFKATSSVTVQVKLGGNNPPVITLTLPTDKNGRGKGSFTPGAAGNYLIDASDGSHSSFATLKVVIKK